MDKKKIISILFLAIIYLFTATGCTVKYKLNIDESGITEKLNVLENKNISDDEALDSLDSIIGANTGEGGLIYDGYKINKIIDNNHYGIELFLQDYQMSSFINSCYDKFNINYNNGYYVLETGEKFSCFNMWDNNYDVEISINVDGTVIENNADSHNGSTYIWNLKNGNSKKIYIKYNFETKQNNMYWIYIIIGLSVIIVGVVIYFVMRNKKANEI